LVKHHKGSPCKSKDGKAKFFAAYQRKSLQTTTMSHSFSYRRRHTKRVGLRQRRKLRSIIRYNRRSIIRYNRRSIIRYNRRSIIRYNRRRILSER
jgi:hypothetical protein